MYDALIKKKVKFYWCSTGPFIRPFLSSQEVSNFCLVNLVLAAEEEISHFFISFAEGAEKQRKYTAENKRLGHYIYFRVERFHLLQLLPISYTS